MEEGEILADKWVKLVPDLRLPQLDHLDRDSVTIQCINSSDFVIGRRTNFNGPVTIINCAEVLKQGCHSENKPTEKKVVIEDKVLSRSAAMLVQKMADEKDKRNEWDFSGGQEKRGVLEKLNRYSKIVLSCVGIIILLVIAAITSIIFYATKTEELDPMCTPLPRNACIYSASSQIDSGVAEKIKQLKTPVPYVVMSQTHDEFCYSVDECLQIVEDFQLRVAENLACNFFLGSDGNVYEGRGWLWENSLEGPAKGKSLLICFLGDYLDDYPTFPQSAAAKNLIRFAVDKNYVSKDYVLVAINATSPTDSLGPALYNVIKKWDHFAETLSRN